PPLFEKSGTHIVFDFGLAGPGNYHVVIVGSPTRQPLQVHVELTVVGLKTGDTLLALVVLVGGLGLMAASLMLSVGAWRRALSAPAPTSEPAPDPASDPASDPWPGAQEATQDTPDDKPRVCRSGVRRRRRLLSRREQRNKRLQPMVFSSKKM